ncbi:cytoskeletal protein RodZ [Microbacterium sp. W4I4]|uniref:hypothetical protein n=1 Tax=Microbacterium sp. W4I4 TaxID=3042295 RepID=UPI002782110B|nr:hypothetical protein [Microbacterium sp. W4I4]MDQ0612588.1 cytoskeletal protein RodZ [Microbacterium sp. W4I4]
MPESLQRTPIFVDAAGRRLRWVRTLLWSVIIVAAIYVLLAFSALLGGPRIDAPFLPQPIVADAPAPSQGLDAPAPATSTPASDAPGSTQRSADPSDPPTPVQTAPARSTPLPSTPAVEPAPQPTQTTPGRSSDASGTVRDTNPGAAHRVEPTGAPVRP